MSQSSEICNHLYRLAREKNGQNVWLNLNGVPVLVIQNHEDALWVLRDNQQNYIKNMRWFRQVLGASRFSEDGEAWKIRQALTQHYFTKFDKEKTCALACHYAHQTLNKLITKSESGQKTISDDALREMATSVLVENFFNIKLSDTTINMHHLANLMEYGSEYSFVPEGQTNALYKEKLLLLPQLRRQILEDFALFRSDKRPINPMLEGMLAADKDPANDIFLEHELLTFFAAGAETTAATIGWACYLLASHPEIQEQLSQESIKFWTTEQPHDWEHLSKLNGLSALIAETLRLYPSTPIIARLAVAEDKIGTEIIPANQNVMISFIGIQHDERFHKTPWELNIQQAKVAPLTNKTSGISTAFSFGPRVCGGKQFALVELAGFLSVFLAYGRFELTSTDQPTFYWKSQMLHQGGQPVKVHSR